MLKIHALKELFLEAFRERLDMHVIAISSSFAAAIDILFAFCIEEVGDWWEDGTYFFAIEESSVNVFKGVFRVFLITVFNIHISNNVISQVIDHDHIFDLTILAHLFEDLLEKCLESTMNEYITW